MTDYEKFQQWLNDCPVKITDYQDFTDQFQITFDVELEEEVITTDDILESPSQWFAHMGNTNVITTQDDYADKVDRLVDNMKTS